MADLARPIAVPEWWDVFTFTNEAVVECPDCDTQSPPLRDIWAAARWVREHYLGCPA
jgi:hypothetical protein